MRVAVTGVGLRTPLGKTPDALVDALLAGHRAARDNPLFPAATYACRLGAAIPDAPERSPQARVLRRMALFGVEAAREAMAQANVAPGPRYGVFCAMGGLRAHWNDIMPALANQREDFAGSWGRGLRSLHPFWMLQHLSNNAHALLAEVTQARGDGLTVTGANAGAQALAAAARAVTDGAVDVAVVMAYDSLLEPETVVEMGARGALFTDDLERLRGPYDLAAAGAVPGEAAAAVVVERPEEARGRTLALVQAASGADGCSGSAEVATLEAVLRRLGAEAQLVDGASAARPEADAAERGVLGALLGERAHLMSIQAATGLLGAATAVVQTIVLSRLLQRGLLPPIAGLAEPAPGHLIPVRAAGPSGAQAAVGVSLGAPGLAAAVAVSRP